MDARHTQPIQDKHLFFLVNSNTYQNTHENSNNNVLNQVYNTLHNQNTITKWPNFYTDISLTQHTYIINTNIGQNIRKLNWLYTSFSKKKKVIFFWNKRK